MRSTLRVDAAGLVAAVERLRGAAADITGPAVALHPPLAPDETSIAAAGRLNAAAAALDSAASAQAAALAATAEHLAAVARGFAAQESANAVAVGALNPATEPVGSPGPLAPLPDAAVGALPPLPVPTEVDGELIARRLAAGSASAGSGFIQSWRGRAVAAASARDGIRDVASALPDVWSSADGTDTVVVRLSRHADAFAGIAESAAELARQADVHSGDYSAAVTNSPKPAEFDDVRARLQQALEANAEFPGQYTPLVSSLIAEQGELRQQAVNTQAGYHGQTETNTSQLSAALPQMVPGLLGALGGLVGGAVSAAAQVPQALLQTGQQLAQAATQGLSSAAASPASGIDSAATGLDAEAPGAGTPGAAPSSGTTAAAGPAETTPVSSSSSSSPAPPNATTPGGAPPTAVAASGPTPGPAGMPMGMLPTSGSAQSAPAVEGDKKIVVPVVPHTEPVTGRATAERLEYS